MRVKDRAKGRSTSKKKGAEKKPDTRMTKKDEEELARMRGVKEEIKKRRGRMRAMPGRIDTPATSREFHDDLSDSIEFAHGKEDFLDDLHRLEAKAAGVGPLNVPPRKGAASRRIKPMGEGYRGSRDRSARQALKDMADKMTRDDYLYGNFKKGGKVKQDYKKGGSVKKSSKKSIDGIAQRGKTRGTMR
jgi:hypothetical protein